LSADLNSRYSDRWRRFQSTRRGPTEHRPLTGECPPPSRLLPEELESLLDELLVELEDSGVAGVPRRASVSVAPRPSGSTEVALTEAGRRVLAGRGQYAGVDHWIGGVHLGPGQPSWRYDDRLETLVRPGHEDRN
jgi:hypothetical protein